MTREEGLVTSSPFSGGTRQKAEPGLADQG